MEVLSFISNTEKVMEHFSYFIKNYSLLKFESSDFDTHFYMKPNSDKNEIYFHLFFNTKEEIDLNFTNGEQLHLSEMMNNFPFYMFDIQYREEFFVTKLLLDFREKLNEINPQENLIILISFGNNQINHFYP